MIRAIVTWLLVALLAAAVIGGIVWAYDTWHDSIESTAYTAGDRTGAARVKAQWDEDRAQAQAAAIEDARQKAAETKRRLERQKENDDAQQAQVALARADASRARAAADGLQLTASAYLDAAGCGGRVGDSAAECIRTAVARVLDVFGSCGNRVAELAATVDDARSRGQRCEADYDALVLKPAK